MGWYEEKRIQQFTVSQGEPMLNNGKMERSVRDCDEYLNAAKKKI